MSAKSTVMLGMIIGSTIGGFVPLLWGDSLLSYASILGNGAGGIIGIILAFKLTQS